jgi:hypothetical protein
VGKKGAAPKEVSAQKPGDGERRSMRDSKASGTIQQVCVCVCVCECECAVGVTSVCDLQTGCSCVGVKAVGAKPCWYAKCVNFAPPSPKKAAADQMD